MDNALHIPRKPVALSWGAMGWLLLLGPLAWVVFYAAYLLLRHALS